MPADDDETDATDVPAGTEDGAIDHAFLRSLTPAPMASSSTDVPPPPWSARGWC